jgi:phosphoglucosamine mutase
MGQIDFGDTLKKMGIENAITGVGDRCVMAEIHLRGAVLGGEESGHTVFLDHQTTGDGLLTALKLIEIMQIENKPLTELKNVMTVFLQVLINVAVKGKPPLESLPELMAVIKNVEKDLDGKGRVLVRYSGTQPQCRILVEGPTIEELQNHCNWIALEIKF